MRRRFAVNLFGGILLVAIVAGCTQLQDWILPTPNVPGEWNALLRVIDGKGTDYRR